VRNVRLAGWGAKRGQLLACRGAGLDGALALLLLNVADAVMTALLLEARLASEANPLMRLAWDASPYAFFGIKLTLVGGAVAILARHRGHLAAGATLYAGLGIYAMVVGYHMVWYGTLVLSWVLGFLT
jgi:hypothetical protein